MKEHLNLRLNRDRLLQLGGATLLVFIGILAYHQSLQNTGKQQRLQKYVGSVLYLVGWALVALIVSRDMVTGEFEQNLFLKRGLPAIGIGLLGATGQWAASQGAVMMSANTVAVIGAWAVFVYFGNEEKTQETRWLTGVGAGLVLLSGMSIMVKENMLRSKKLQTYNLEVPALAIGLLLVVVGLSLE